MEQKEFVSLWEKGFYMLKKLPRPGLLLVTGDREEKNVMTIGWLSLGITWNEPVVSILVRPSRFSHTLLEKYNEFTINFLPDNFNEIISVCGSKSGKYCDKFKETGLAVKPSKKINTLSLKDAEITLECEVLYKSKINPEVLNDLILARYYANGDYHWLYIAKIVEATTNIL